MTTLLLRLLILFMAIEGTRAAFHFASEFAKRSRPTSATPNLGTNSRRSASLFMETAHSCPSETSKQIYNIPDSGWRSKKWSWGSARGTGHDCAAICRRRWDDESDRRDLVQSLLDPAEFKGLHPHSEVPFEEIKLILGLAWQRGRRDGTDGGPGQGYGAVLETMAEARRYENEDEVISALNFIDDVSGRFASICRDAEKLKRMKAIANDIRGKHAEKEEVFMARRMCAGMVLDAMNFVESGL
ncbi:hypothetical protein ACHAW5_011207 [Stephanodiscus triporus]|uniref:Co-chaperone HscB C-terminal oligomerisation domain-containing protein n=1 Tax=Stephanodiscus triporus TaxID=2934178 RepID=A0ABD3PBV2_9STRA